MVERIYQNYSDEVLREAYKDYLNSVDIFEENGLESGIDYGHVIANEVLKRSGGPEKVNDWVENKKDPKLERIAKENFLTFVRSKKIISLESAVPCIKDYINKFGDLEVGLSYKENDECRGGDGSIFVQDFYKILKCVFKGTGFGYDSSRNLFNEIDQDILNALTYAVKPLRVKGKGCIVELSAE